MDAFKKIVFSYYGQRGRDLPWRKTDDPYAVLVSEIMLQQTQVPRVVEKYKAWIRRFPTHFDLAKVDMAAILPYWVGLGYNRRAQYLKCCADEIVAQYHGIFPSSVEALQKLPGIGLYTAQAICVYAFNQPLPLIETNVRTVFIHHFFPDIASVSDIDILPLVEQTMDRQNPRAWFNALMDYGTDLKILFPNPSRKSAVYTKQSPLKGSVREVRGWIMKQLSSKPSISRTIVLDKFSDTFRVERAIAGLIKDGFVVVQNDILLLK